MNYSLLAGGLLVGGAIGLLFGNAQFAAFQRNALKQKSGRSTSPSRAMPGSFGRIALLVLGLLLIQLLCPWLFADGTAQWSVAAGVVLGYGWTLMQRLRTPSAG
jgi:hypothetical protein